MTSMKKSEFFHHVLLFDPSMDVHVRWSILFLSFLLTENVVLLAGLGMRAYFDFDFVSTGITTRHRELALSTVWTRSYPGVPRSHYRLQCHRKTTT